jgi:hypothetical protein
VRNTSGSIGFLAIGVCFTIISSIMIHALANGYTLIQYTITEPCSSIVLAIVGYIGFITSWKELTINVNSLDKRFTTTTRNVITCKLTKQEAKFSEIQSMQRQIDEVTRSVKVTISRDNHDNIQFHVKSNFYWPLEKYLKTLLPKIPIISRETSMLDADMSTGHINAVC